MYLFFYLSIWEYKEKVSQVEIFALALIIISQPSPFPPKKNPNFVRFQFKLPFMQKLLKSFKFDLPRQVVGDNPPVRQLVGEKNPPLLLSACQSSVPCLVVLRPSVSACLSVCLSIGLIDC